MINPIIGAAQDTVIKRANDLLNALMAYTDIADRVPLADNEDMTTLFFFYRCLKDTHIAIDSVRAGIQERLKSTMENDVLVDEQSGELLAQIKRYTRTYIDVEGLRLAHPELCDEFTIRKEQTAFYSITSKEKV